MNVTSTRTGCTNDRWQPFFVTEVLDAPARRRAVDVRDAVFARTAGLSTAGAAPLWTSPPWFPTRWTSPWCATVAGTPRTRRSTSASGPASSAVTAAELWFRHELARLAIEESMPDRAADGDPRRACWPPRRRGRSRAALPTMRRRPVTPDAVLRYAPVRRRARGRTRRTPRGAGTATTARCGSPARRTSAARPSSSSGTPSECRLTVPYRRRPSSASARALSIWDSLGEVDRRARRRLGTRCCSGAAGRSIEARTRGGERGVARWSGTRPDRRWPRRSATSRTLKMLARDIPGAIETGLRAVALADAYDQQTFLATRAERGRLSAVVRTRRTRRQRRSPAAWRWPARPETTSAIAAALWSTSVRARVRCGGTPRPTAGYARRSRGAPSGTSTRTAAYAPGVAGPHRSSSRVVGRRRPAAPPEVVGESTTHTCRRGSWV